MDLSVIVLQSEKHSLKVRGAFTIFKGNLFEWLVVRFNFEKKAAINVCVEVVEGKLNIFKQKLLAYHSVEDRLQVCICWHLPGW